MPIHCTRSDCRTIDGFLRTSGTFWFGLSSAAPAGRSNLKRSNRGASGRTISRGSTISMSGFRSYRRRPKSCRGRWPGRGRTSGGRRSRGDIAQRWARPLRATSSTCSRRCRSGPTCPSAATVRTTRGAIGRSSASCSSRPARRWRSERLAPVAEPNGTQLALARRPGSFYSVEPPLHLSGGDQCAIPPGPPTASSCACARRSVR